MEEWTVKHRRFEICEEVVWDEIKQGKITSYDCPMNEYRVDFPDGSYAIVSPFDIEPIN